MFDITLFYQGPSPCRPDMVSNSLENGPKHVRGQAAGIGVVARAVIAVEKGKAIKFCRW